MKYIITGGSGFLGTAISRRLVADGHEVVSLDLVPPRVDGVKFHKASMTDGLEPNEMLAHADVWINLAGRPIFGRWTPEVKKQIYNSRVVGTRNMVALFADPTYRPNVLVQASAVGCYGNVHGAVVDESSPKGEGFLADVVADWEHEALEAKKHGVHVTILRNGIIVGDGGILRVLRPFYMAYIGGPVGDGKQYRPWIHIEDVARMYCEAARGAYPELINAVAPERVTNGVFSCAFAESIHRPCWLHIPRFALRLRYGKFADEILASQQVISKTLPDTFTFTHPTIKDAMNNV